ncbi:MAG TPA: alanine--tRNA ligase, partial [Actinobacteria bacterium]|nr:alanine--tRNA ligase [Actinomycetes bacterium]HEX21477.1 alanine--tRNA ligase [Actinomycetota bacterium]
DTYGFPLELTIEIADESGLKVDINSFNKLMSKQRERARAEGVTAEGHASIYVGNVYPKVVEKYGKSDFTGYETDQVEAKIVAIAADDQLVLSAKTGDEVELFLDHTPFYAEKGGQIGDVGIMTSETGKARVLDTSAPLADLIAHKVKVIEGGLESGQTVNAVIDKRRRRSISRNHTATHLLQWALRIILGEHVKQAGSFVGADRLRFDFTHHQPLSSKEIGNIQRLVNEKILQNHPVRTYITTLDYAKDIGATALFEEKYGKYVRVVEIGDFSKELCGGVHLGNTSEVGFIKITSVSSIGANTRRIEAITGERFLEDHRRVETELKQISELLGVKDGQVYQAVENLKQKAEKERKTLASLRSKQMEGEVENIINDKIMLGDIVLLTHALEFATMDELRILADRLRSAEKSSIVVLASSDKGKATLLIAATPALIKLGFSSVDMLKKIAPIIGGGGGGRADLAQAGGKDPDGIAELFPAAKKFVEDFTSSRA